LSSAKSYRYFKFLIISNNGHSVIITGQIKLLNDSTSIIPNMTSANTPSPYIITGTNFGSYYQWHAFTGWDPTPSGNGWWATPIDNTLTSSQHLILPNFSSINNKNIFIKAK
jgi:hypothetical protein